MKKYVLAYKSSNQLIIVSESFNLKEVRKELKVSNSKDFKIYELKRKK